MIAVDIAVDLNAILKIPPLVDQVVAVGVKKSTQHLSRRTQHFPSGVTATPVNLDTAHGNVGRFGFFEVDIGLKRLELLKHELRLWRFGGKNNS